MNVSYHYGFFRIITRCKNCKNKQKLENYEARVIKQFNKEKLMTTLGEKLVTLFVNNISSVNKVS